MDESIGMAIDQPSYKLGMTTAFVEMVAAGVKKLGLSPPLDPEELDRLMKGADRVAKSYGVHLYLEKDFLTTDLFDPEFTRAKYVLMIFKDPMVKEAYMALKAEKEGLIKAGRFEGEPRKEVARKFGHLLGYPDDHIGRMLSEAPTSPYVLD